MLKVAIYSQKKDSESMLYIHKVIDFLEEKKVNVFVFSELAQEEFFFGNYPVFSDKKSLENQEVDYFFTFGGDGTILNALTLIQDLEIPVVGVNMGRLGFLASFNKDEFLSDLNDILEEKYLVSPRSVIQVISNNCIDFPFALNDVVLTRKETTSMITVEAEIDGNFLSMFWGDGLIVATPSGSTAYSLSCGGAIIEPENDNFLLTPIAPHNLNMRPIILKDNVEIRLKVSSREPKFSLGLDSRLYHMDTENDLILKKAPFNLRLVSSPKINFYETLRQKLLWGNDKRN